MTAAHLIVTGGTGYLGTRLVRTALAQGRSVTLLGRTPGPAGTRFVPWSLGELLPREALRDDVASQDQAIIAMAHDWNGDEGPDGNVVGTARLFVDAADAGIGAKVFISSQSARADAPNRYGRIKWAIEQTLEEAVSLRVGLVYGGPRVAMYGLMCKLARLRLLPMVEPQRLVQPIHIDEVVDGILAAADGPFVGVLALAGPTPIPFSFVLKMLAEKLARRRLTLIPLNMRLVLLCCDFARAILPSSRIDRERVLGLAGTKPIESAQDLTRLGIRVAPMAERLTHEPAARRAVLAEAQDLLRACSGRRAPPSLLRRYARATPTGAIGLPVVTAFLLRWCEPVGGMSDLASRLRLASRLLETSPHGEAALAGGSRVGRILRLGLELALEGLFLPARLMARVVSK